ncbi:alkaline phosphatase family protein [Luteimonas yindakuii]|uniref:Alkaline phosphatase family protein n=1 Tax=Luteimonas yindakuii TaxID=2565782 RepID=A0A4Z1R4P7_9GAMM|nr:ectonucleotide pyrophosphatase/phosphodiesterase [Luteimonas yindakuii]QCU72676.1 alkaline phosphatase family protein [Luteimonas yindakuii]TKS54532.1 alkaline phosphatase family protein [Luteimonas yindakuii]
MTFRFLSAVLAACLLSACSTSPRTTPGDASDAPTLLLVSLDGVHPDMLGHGDTPRLDRLAREGVSGWMRPSYPALTFPNHYTLVTGLRPDRHGLIHNSMYDEDLGRFALKDRDAVGDGRWWGGEPLWVTAERAGLPTATMFWPGSEAPVQGVRPRRWFPYEEGLALEVRIGRVLGWLAEPAATRPRLATLYFEHPDHAGHGYGPDSPQLRSALREVDAAIGDLLDGIAAAGLQDRVNLVIVSDHGMAPVPPGQVVAVEDMVDPADAEPVSTGQVVGFRPRAGREAAADAALLGAHEHYDCWRREALPARWHYGRHPRVPPIVCQMHVGWDALPRAHIARRPDRTRGSHGYDPAAPGMRAVFIAHGPAFARGVELPGFDNIDVYPLLARVLGVAPAEHDGDAATLLPALHDGD